MPVSINEGMLAPLKGTVRTDATHAPDPGPVEGALLLNLTLVLKRTPGGYCLT